MNLKAPLSGIKGKLDDFVSRFEDEPDQVKRRMERLRTLRSEMEKAYQLRVKEDSTGIMQVIEADGLGEEDNATESHPLEIVFDRVEGSLLRPIPVDNRINS